MPPLFAPPKPKQPAGENLLARCVIAGVFLGLTYAVVNLELHVSRHTAVMTASQGGSSLQLDGVRPATVAASTRAATTASGLESSGIGKLGPLGYPSTAEKVSRLSQPEYPGINPQCHARIHTDFSGEMAGGSKMGPENKQPDPGACCASCMAHKGSTPCNVWVWNNNTHECWLKHLKFFPERPILWRGEESPWVGGSFFDYGEPFDPARHPIDVPAPIKAASKVKDYQPPACIHTVLTSNGNSYMNWQTRVMYATYKAAAAAEGPNGLFRAFTRVLHRSSDDELMKEVPTMRFDPKRCTKENWCSFPVADRSQALADWSKTPDAYQCSHIMMVEADYLYVRALPPWILPARGHAVGFHFGYIVPSVPEMAKISRRFFPESLGSLDTVPQTGNAPQLLHGDDFRAIMPLWAEIQEKVEADQEAIKEFNWVRDMYAYSFAVAKLGIRHHVPLVPYNHMMVQPPADVVVGDGAILHYTWGPIINVGGKVLWQFDKRQYQGGQGAAGPVKLEKLDHPPPWREGMRLQANETVTPDGLLLMDLFVDIFNLAVESLPELPVGCTSRTACEELARSP